MTHPECASTSASCVNGIDCGISNLDLIGNHFAGAEDDRTGLRPANICFLDCVPRLCAFSDSIELNNTQSRRVAESHHFTRARARMHGARCDSATLRLLDWIFLRLGKRLNTGVAYITKKAKGDSATQ